MAQRPTADYPIDANTTSGTDLSLILNRFQTALESGNSGASRPAYITAGGLWVKEGDPMELYLYDGTTDQLLYDTSNGINVTEGLWTLVDENNEAGEIQRPSDVLIDGNLTVTGEVVDSDGNPISIIDPATEDGVVATWDDTAKQWTPDNAVVVSGGNVGIGGAPLNNNAKLWMHGPICFGNDGGNWSGFIKTEIDGQDTNFVIANASGGTENHILFETNAGEALRIDGQSGNATFSGTVNTGGFVLDKAGYLQINHTDTSDPTAIYTNGNMFLAGVLQGPGNTWSIDATGNATFSGSVRASNFTDTTDALGLFFSSSLMSIYPRNSTGPINNQVDLGTSSYLFRNVFAANVRMASGTAIGTRDLIETLSTLRNATKDEETLEGLRDAISDAIGGLIQKFEAIQAEAQEKLEEAYNQTGTQEITPDKGTKDDKPEAGTMDIEE